MLSKNVWKEKHKASHHPTLKKNKELHRLQVMISGTLKIWKPRNLRNPKKTERKVLAQNQHHMKVAAATTAEKEPAKPAVVKKARKKKVMTTKTGKMMRFNDP